MLDKEKEVKLSWSMPQVNEINIKMTEKQKPYSGNDGIGIGQGPAGGSDTPPVS
ncbi:hypothetical protein ACOBQJ_14235 [Pelotomaculum propionicicum]|uniref:hypothetical protein n=1 Tax=Pelotomaculum propionicicum TaxID=258475 RepID=UPI003B7B1DB0